jgi:hypothetical protein
MLRLGDFPAGYVYGDDRGCGVGGTTEGTQPEVDKFLIETRPSICFGELTRSWGGPSQVVRTALFRFRKDADAERAWELRKPLFDAYVGISLTTEHSGEDDAVAFDSKGLNYPGAGEAWRDGRLVAAGVRGGRERRAGPQVRRRACGQAAGPDRVAVRAERARRRSRGRPQRSCDRRPGLLARPRVRVRRPAEARALSGRLPRRRSRAWRGGEDRARGWRQSSRGSGSGSNGGPRPWPSSPFTILLPPPPSLTDFAAHTCSLGAR